MKIIKATSDNEEEISQFYSSQVLHGPLDLKASRPKNFFLQYELQGQEYDVYLLRDSKNQIAGLASIVFKEAYLHREKVRVGYCSDLRIAPTREAVLTWTKHFLPILHEGMESKKCDYYFSVVAPQESRAFNALVRPRSSRRSIPRFYMLSRFEMINILGRWPWAPKPLDTLVLKKGDASHLDALLEYLVQKSQVRTLSTVYTKDLLLQRFNSWPGFSYESFILAFDYQNNIVGCTAPWDNFEVQHYQVDAYKGLMKTLYSAAQFGSYLGLTQRLPKEGEYLNFAYLTHLYADNPDIFYNLVYEAQEQNHPHKSLLYPYFHNDLTTLPPKGFISVAFPLAVYSILPPEKPLPEFLRINRLTDPVDLELAFL